MDYTITNYTDYVLSDGTFRVAKLNNKTKKPVLLANFNNALKNLTTQEKMAKAQQIVNEVGSSSHSYDIVLGKLAMTTESIEHYTNVEGTRKLKVNEIVKDRVSNVYNATKKEEVKKEEAPVASGNNNLQDTKETIMNEMPKNNDVQPPVVDKTYEENVQQAYITPVTTRASRLEQRSEASDVINTPDRFRSDRMPYEMDAERNFYSRVERASTMDEKNPYTESVNSLVNDRAYKGELVVGRDRETLDKIDRIHNDQGISLAHNTAEDLQAAYDNFSNSEKRKKDSIDEVLSLEKKVKEAKERLQRKLAERAEKIADLNAKAKANDDETADYTMHLENLRNQLADYMRQIDEGGFDYENEPSHGMRR